MSELINIEVIEPTPVPVIEIHVDLNAAQSAIDAALQAQLILEQMQELILGSTAQTYVITQGTINILGDQVTFTGFAWKIDGVDYAQTVPIVRTLPFAAIGMYRTHTAYFTNTNSIEIAVGPEDNEITTEPSIPPGTLRMQAFNVFGEVITISTGETLPYDINLLDELLQNPASGDMMLINVGGVDYRVNFQRLIDVLGGGGGGTFDLQVNEIGETPISSVNQIEFDGATVVDESGGKVKVTIAGGGGGTLQDLQSVLDTGKVATFTTPDGTQVDLLMGGESDLTEAEFRLEMLRDYGDVYQHIAEVKNIGQFVFSQSVFNSLTETGKIAQVSMINGEAQLLKLNVNSNFSAIQKFEFDDILSPPSNLDIVYKPKPKATSGTYYLATLDDIDNAIEGLKTKQPVRVATTANITLSGLAMIDGIPLSESDRVLVKDQTNAWLNGIYLASDLNWTRASDANTATELTNAVVSVLEGTANGQGTFRQIATSIVLETSNIIWSTFGSSVPDATSTTKGKAKLYSEFGTNTDGSVTQKAINDALILKANLTVTTYNFVSCKTLSPPTPVAGAGGTTDVEIYKKLIPANTFSNLDEICIDARFVKQNSNGTTLFRILHNPVTDNFATASSLGSSGTWNAGSQRGVVRREYVVRGTNLSGVSTSFNSPTDEQPSTAGGALNTFVDFPFDPTVNNWVYLSVRGSSALDTYQKEMFEIKITKNLT